MEGLDVALGLPLLALVTLFGIETAPCEGFGVFFGVSFGWGHGAFLRMVCCRYRVRRKPCPIWSGNCQSVCKINGAFV